MAADHEKWLQGQGVRIMDHRTLRRAHIAPYSVCASDDPINWAPLKTTTETMYQVELDERTIERFERTESDIKHALETANRRSNSPGYRGPISTSDISEFYIKNRERHFELLQENSMYRDAWREFQSIRVLIGETPHWP